ncbi:MAG: phospholipase [Bacteroidia bacterium]|nr:phospholipase [Bacteroidia bacterium]
MKHADMPPRSLGPVPGEAARAMILVHGRGGSAEDILSLMEYLDAPDLHAVAPQAAGHSWYPYSFLAPMEQNEPYLGQALEALAQTEQRLLDAGFGRGQLYWLGFSQGACLTLEYTARHAARYGGIFALSGGLIGPPGTPRAYPGTFGGTPLLLGCSDTDPHIPRARVEESADVLARMGAAVDLRLYPRAPHSVLQDEIDAIRSILAQPAV